MAINSIQSLKKTLTGLPLTRKESEHQKLLPNTTLLDYFDTLDKVQADCYYCEVDANGADTRILTLKEQYINNRRDSSGNPIVLTTGNIATYFNVESAGGGSSTSTTSSLTSIGNAPAGGTTAGTAVTIPAQGATANDGDYLTVTGANQYYSINGQTVKLSTGDRIIWNKGDNQYIITKAGENQTSTEVPFTAITGSETQTAIAGTNVQDAISNISTELKNVDEVLTFATLAGFPATGDTGKLYKDLATNRIYHWNGTSYIELGTKSTFTDECIFPVSTATSGKHFDNSNDDINIFFPKVSTDTATINRATLFIDSGTFPASTTTIKLQKLTGAVYTDIATFTVPASSTGTITAKTAISGVLSGTPANLNLADGDMIVVDCSQNVPSAGFFIVYTATNN